MFRAAAVVLSLTFAAVGPSYANVPAGTSDLVRYLLTELDDIRGTLEKREAAGEGSWLTSGAADYQENLDEALDAALAVIEPDTHTDWKQSLSNLDKATSEAEELRSEIKLQFSSGTVASEGIRMVDRLLQREVRPGSETDLRSRLLDVETAIATLEGEQTHAVDGFAEAMQAEHGIALDHQQARALLLQVNGALIVDSMVIIQTLKAVEEQLANVASDGQSAEAMRRYLGAASLTRLVYARMLARHLSAYEDRWLPMLAERQEEVERLRAQTQASARTTTEAGARATFEANAETQEIILEVTESYRSMLKDRRDVTAEALGRATQRADAAINTLQTLEAATAVSAIVSEAFTDYDALGDIEVPELLSLDNEVILNEFTDLTRELEAGS